MWFPFVTMYPEVSFPLCPSVIFPKFSQQNSANSWRSWLVFCSSLLLIVKQEEMPPPLHNAFFSDEDGRKRTVCWSCSRLWKEWTGFQDLVWLIKIQGSPDKTNLNEWVRNINIINRQLPLLSYSKLNLSHTLVFFPFVDKWWYKVFP